MFDNYANNQATQPQTPPAAPSVIRFDKAYLRSSSGILKLIQIISNILGFICTKVSSAWVSSIFFNILYSVANIVTILLYLMYMFHVVEKLDQWPWLKGEFYYCIVIVLTYIGCSIFATTLAESVGYAVGFFGLCAIIAYSLDGYLKYKAWKRGLPPQ